MPWDDNWEKFTTGKKSRLFQQALEEAYEWQKESYKRVPTRRRAPVKPKEIPLPAALMAEKRKHEKAVMKVNNFFFINQLSTFKELCFLFFVNEQQQQQQHKRRKKHGSGEWRTFGTFIFLFR
jgi:hypothetical protein